MSMTTTPVSSGEALVARLFGSSYRGIVAIAGLALVALYMSVLFPAASIKSGSPDNKVVDLQRSYDVDTFVNVLRRWSEKNEGAVGIMKKENIWKLDSSFPLLYGLTFAFLFAWLTGRPRPTRLDAVLFVTPLAAALFDYMENTLELYALRGIETLANVNTAAETNAFPAAAILGQSVCAHIKYVLLLVSLVALVIALVGRGLRFAR
jgi:hypothetical protein